MPSLLPPSMLSLRACLQLALIMAENVHWEFRRFSTGQAGRVAIQNLQIDNQLLTAAQPVILAKASRVRPALMPTRVHECLSTAALLDQLLRYCVTISRAGRQPWHASWAVGS